LFLPDTLFQAGLSISRLWSTRISEATFTHLSIIVPAHNEGWRLPDTLGELFAFLAPQSYRAEVIVVENGSSDDTAAVVRRLMTTFDSLRLITLAQAGKGRAVKAGVLASSGEAVFQCDADLSTPAAEIPRFVRALAGGYDIVVGSREGVGAIRYGEPEYRHIMGRAFNALVQRMAVPDIEDTQCGFKAYTAESARRLFGMQTITGWAFDVELLYLARKYGLRVAELPVEWRFNDDTKVRALRDTRAMLTDILKVRLNDMLGRYPAVSATEAARG
jgi:dolichyl-phosphate beta-glucosyltransferase